MTMTDSLTDTVTPGAATSAADTPDASPGESQAIENRTVPALPQAAIIGDSPADIWGMSSVERLRRQLVRAGVTAVRSWSEAPDPGTAPQILLRADFVFDEVLVRDLVRAPGTLLLDPASGEAVAAHVDADNAPAVALVLLSGQALPDGQFPALRTVRPGELSSDYNNALRKKEPPFLLRLTPGTVPAIERRTFDGSYKGVTDLVTKYVWPRPAQAATKWCALNAVTPNQVTTASAALVVLAFISFWMGWFVIGLLFAWGMTFLDTVDGKLARVTLTSSKWGNVFDHGIDLVHPPFWWWAWVVGLGAAGMPLGNEALVLAILVGGYVAQRLQEGLFLALFKIEIHIWRRFDSQFRLVTARRNPNLLLLTAFTLFGRPDLGMLAVTIWTAASFLVHTAQILQAFEAKRHGPVRSWLAP